MDMANGNILTSRSGNEAASANRRPCGQDSGKDRQSQQ